MPLSLMLVNLEHKKSHEYVADDKIKYLYEICCSFLTH